MSALGPLSMFPTVLPSGLKAELYGAMISGGRSCELCSSATVHEHPTSSQAVMGRCSSELARVCFFREPATRRGPRRNTIGPTESRLCWHRAVTVAQLGA
jgi:hypothetical protein